MKSTNTKGFTLVELIIVITILAILATIAFISFQSYTKDARDSSKKAEIANIVKVMAASEAKSGISPLSYIKGTIGTLELNNVQGLSGQTNTGSINTELLGLNNSKYANEFEIAVYTGTLNVYQIRAEMENQDENGKYFVSGTYSPRTSTVTGSGVDATTINLTAGAGLVKVGDVLEFASTKYTVSGISSDMSKLTVTGGDASSVALDSNYTYAENKSLFGN